MKRYKMTDEQLKELLSACEPVPAIALHCGPMPTQQERVNAAWRALGDELGFDYMTVKPLPGEPKTVFVAEPKEGRVQKEDQ